VSQFSGSRDIFAVIDETLSGIALLVQWGVIPILEFDPGQDRLGSTILPRKRILPERVSRIRKING